MTGFGLVKDRLGVRKHIALTQALGFVRVVVPKAGCRPIAWHLDGDLIGTLDFGIWISLRTSLLFGCFSAAPG